MIDEDDTSDVEMDVKFWHEMLDLYFIRGRESKGGHEDDLIFFVKDMVTSPITSFSVRIDKNRVL